MNFLRAFGHSLPDRIVTNAELAPLLGVDPEWILGVCGIEQRRYAAPEETVVDLGCAAADACLRHAGVAADDIQFVLVACGSPDVYCPGPASAIAARLGMAAVPALDLPLASAGSLAALVLAESLAERFGNVLVIATEIMSRRIELTPEGKDTAILFGDGAGACLLSRDTGFAAIKATALHTDGERAETIQVRDGRFHMDGVAVIRQASQRLPAVLNEVLEQGGVAAADVGQFLIHQANLKLLERVAKVLKVPGDKLFTNIERYGNTSSASLLIAASEWHAGAQRVTQPLALAAFGAGLTWGALLAVPV